MPFQFAQGKDYPISNQPWRLSSRSFAPSGEFINRAALSYNKNEHNIVFHRIDNPVIPDAQFVKPAYRHAPEATVLNPTGFASVVENHHNTRKGFSTSFSLIAASIRRTSPGCIRAKSLSTFG
jgi:hypothetical protein